jgi:hypothetical protein
LKTIRNVRHCFRFRCSRLWEDLAATDRAEVRHCGHCEGDVYFCQTDEETLAHARAGHCIAREAPDDSELPKIYIGQPAQVIEPSPSQEEAGRWKRRESAIDDSLRNAASSTRSCPRCSYPAPNWRKTCRVCGFEMGRATGEANI